MDKPDDPGRLADELDTEADKLEQRSGELGEEIGEVRQDWERKRGDDAVPGAVPRREDPDREENAEEPSADNDEDEDG